MTRLRHEKDDWFKTSKLAFDKFGRETCHYLYQAFTCHTISMSIRRFLKCLCTTETTSKNLSVLTFLQYCVFPRCCLTANDAVFCARFIHALHHIQTLNFSSLICYDRVSYILFVSFLRTFSLFSESIFFFAF